MDDELVFLIDEAINFTVAEVTKSDGAIVTELEFTVPEGTVRTARNLAACLFWQGAYLPSTPPPPGSRWVQFTYEVNTFKVSEAALDKFITAVENSMDERKAYIGAHAAHATPYVALELLECCGLFSKRS